MRPPDAPLAQVLLLTGSDPVRRTAYALGLEVEGFALLPDWTEDQLRAYVGSGHRVVIADRTGRREDRALVTDLVEQCGGTWARIRVASSPTDAGPAAEAHGEDDARIVALPTVRCVGAIVHDDAGRLLVVQRAHPPAEGTWSLPGGRVEAGETDTDAVVREVWEETGLTVGVGPRVGTVERPAPGAVYEIHDYAAQAQSGQLRAATDAADARWVSTAELLELPTAPDLVETLRAWGQLRPEP